MTAKNKDVRIPSEPEEDPGAVIATTRRAKGSKTDDSLSHLPHKRRGEIVDAKVSPKYPFRCEASSADYVYGPFHYDAVDESDAKSQLLQEYPDLMENVTKMTFKAVRLSDTPVNLDKLTEEQVARVNRLRRRRNDKAENLKASFGATTDGELEQHRKIVDARDETKARHTGPSQEDIDSGAAAGPRVAVTPLGTAPEDMEAAGADKAKKK